MRKRKGKQGRFWWLALRHRWHRMVHFEYWPMFVFYAPLLPVWFYYALKSRNPFYFTAVNPGIKNGGFFNSSKHDILEQIPNQWTPESVILKPGETLDLRSLQFPLVVKPDNGLRGKGVHIIENENQLASALEVDYPVLIQSYVELPYEFGVFYFHNALTNQSGITGVTGKKFLTVTGDGKSTMEELLRRTPRASAKILYYKTSLKD